MRYAIVSDLHANAQAWNAALTDIGSNGVDRILCLGDVVGYGPDPAKVLASVHRHVHALVLGNHDAVVCGKMSPEVFNDRARQVILWTQTQLGRTAREFLGTLPLTLSATGFRCAHGTFANPAAFDYVLEAGDAPTSWNAVPEPLLFVGHSHTPGIFVLGRSGVPHKLSAQDFALEPGKRYIVNVGSVGSPRDGDARACYVIYDEAAGSVIFRRIPFDQDAFREAVAAAGLNPEDLPVLRRDPRRQLASVREDLDFSPATNREQEARNVTAVGEVERMLRRSASRWRKAAFAAAVLAIASSVGAFAVARSGRPVSLAVPMDPLDSVGTTAPSSADGGFLPALPDAVGPDGGVRPWRILYGDRARQSAEVLLGDETAPRGRLVLRSSAPKSVFRMEAPSIRMEDEGGRKFRLLGEARRSAGFEGHVGIVVDVLRSLPDGSETWVLNHEAVEFRQARGSSSWDVAQKTLGEKELPKYVREVRIALTGTFRGEIEIRSLHLNRP